MLLRLKRSLGAANEYFEKSDNIDDLIELSYLIWRNPGFVLDFYYYLHKLIPQ